MEFIHIRVPRETRQAFKAYTASLGVSMTAYLGELIKRVLEDKRELTQ